MNARALSRYVDDLLAGRLWFDQADDRLRCPCHSTSFSPTGQVLSHQLRSTPAPLPQLDVRERNGAIEVFAPIEPPQPS
jgi:cytochrome b6-f complex iron-sulfur subunit